MPIVICCGCGDEKKHHAHGLCKRCYTRDVFRKKPMTDIARNTKNKRSRRYRKNNKESIIEKRHKLRLQVLTAYGGDPPVCACCGEDHVSFLTIDHINSDGAEQRRKEGIRSSDKLYRWLKTHNYPPEYQVLCWNCNCGRAMNGGVCPHEFDV